MENIENSSKEELLHELESLRKKTSELASQLKESETKFKDIFEYSPLGKSLTNIDGSMQINEAFSQILGYSIEDLKTKNWKEITHPEDVQESAQIVQSLLDGKSSKAHYEKRYIHKKGNVIWTDVITILVRDDNEQAKYFYTTIRDITELKQVEEELKESETRLKEAQRIAKLGHYVYDLNTGSWESSKGLNEIFAIDDDYQRDVNGWVEIIHPDFKEIMADYFENHVIKQLQNFDKEYKIKGVASGEEKWVHGLGTLQFDAKNKPIKMFGVIQDITSRKLYEDSLHLSEERNRKILVSAPLPLCYVDNEGRLTFRNERFLKIFGYDETDVPTIKEWWQKAYPDEEYRNWVIPNWEAAVEKASKTGDDIESEVYQVTCKDGTVRDIIISGITLGEDFIATFIDFTERNAAEKQLQKTSMILHEILNTIPIRVFWKDLESNYLGCNLPFAEDAGYEKPEDIIGKTDYDVFLKEHAKNFRADDHAVMQSGIPKIGFEEPQENLNGNNHWLRTSKVPLKDKKGDIVGVLGTYEDISEKKQTENELAQYRENLEELVKERTRDLEAKNKELDNAMKVFVGRELTIRHLQERLKAFESK